MSAIAFVIILVILATLGVVLLKNAKHEPAEVVVVDGGSQTPVDNGGGLHPNMPAE
jgi:hypothetical protein